MKANISPKLQYQPTKLLGDKPHKSTVWMIKVFISNFEELVTVRRTAVAQWLRCCATNRKVAASVPDGVIGIFHWHNPSDRTMALVLNQPLTYEYQEYFLGVKASGAKADNRNTILVHCHVIWEP